MRSSRTLTLAAVLLLAPLGAAAQAAPSSGAASALDAPRGDEGALDAVEIPAPPGAPVDADETDAEARYPIPTPEDAAEAAEADEPAIRLPSRITTRLRSLDASLRSLAQQGGGHIVNAVLSLITGGLSITLGAVKDPNDDWLSAYLYVYGGAAAARGALDLLLAPNPSGEAITYQHMPMTNRAEVRARLRYGERTLEGLARQALVARVLDASLNMAAGVAVVPIYLAPNDFEVSNPLDYFVLIGAGVSIVSGIITLVSGSAAEQRWSAYEELRDRLAQEAAEERGRGDDAGDELDASALAPAGPRLDWRVAGGPLRGGAFAGVGATF